MDLEQERTALEDKYRREDFWDNILGGLLFVASACIVAILIIGAIWLVWVGIEYTNNGGGFIPTLDASDFTRQYRELFGSLGDAVGGLLNPFLTFISIFLLVASLFYSAKQNKFSKRELELTRLEMKSSNHAQKNIEITNKKARLDNFIAIASVKQEQLRANSTCFIAEVDEFGDDIYDQVGEPVGSQGQSSPYAFNKIVHGYRGFRSRRKVDINAMHSIAFSELNGYETYLNYVLSINIHLRRMVAEIALEDSINDELNDFLIFGNLELDQDDLLSIFAVFIIEFMSGNKKYTNRIVESSLLKKLSFYKLRINERILDDNVMSDLFSQYPDLLNFTSEQKALLID
ncbi:hypothetical protein ACKC9G_09485 [Pokkaliibacter sp. CJK22405]|uniref:hypothetical protein n=1 Tax=Pokkaliibacter sp. CJK22405 TaxID=3384615 RepID=UPI003984E955